MKILAIETSCDETCAAVVNGTRILSNIVWSQVDLHKEFGGVVPSLARRAHQEKIDWVVNKALEESGVRSQELGAIAVTVGPGLAIALEVGIAQAKELAAKWHKPLIAVNHIEGHVLSPLANTISPPNPPLNLRGGNPKGGGDISFPAMALIVSGGHTELILVENIGKYKIVARTIDDALGEAVDKAARMLGLGYPGGAELEKAARAGDPKAYKLPLPMQGRENRGEFSYSGLKTAFWRLVNQFSVSQLTSQQIADLAASFQDRAFEHLIRVAKKTISHYNSPLLPPLKLRGGSEGVIHDLLVGGGVAINQELRQRLEIEMGKMGIRVWWPAKGLYGDNAAMIGIAAGFAAQRGEFVKNINTVDRLPRWRIDQKIDW